MKTEKIGAALRCSSQVPGPQLDCRTCPYRMEETVDGVDYAGCDCDRIAVDAADRLEELVERCARYAEEIAVLREAQRWTPVTERLPEDSAKECIVFVPHVPENIVCLGRYLGSGRWVIGGWYLTSEAVACWLPLPEAPQEKALEEMRKEEAP